ncbi:hypothetical protein V6N13_050083 [Hibiscus sabdariffa]|uniref:Uncharacterized protein n=1 Tax=Hibiscus sabdariffa TaxID=183260 RepID=A0ABR2QVC7_9ROSI
MAAWARDEAYVESERRSKLYACSFTIFASFGSLTCRMKPALENPVSELAVVPLRASAVAAEVGADDGGIVVPFWVSATDLLSRMNKAQRCSVLAYLYYKFITAKSLSSDKSHRHIF